MAVRRQPQRSARVSGEKRRMELESQENERTSTIKRVKRTLNGFSSLPFSPPAWSDAPDGLCVEPAADFPCTAPSLLKYSTIDLYRAFFGEDHMRREVCAVCSRNDIRKYNSRLPLDTFVERIKDVSTALSPGLEKLLETGVNIGVINNGILSGLLLDEEGLCGEHAVMCGNCAGSMNPPLALSNGTWVGNVPDVLKDLSLVEEMLIGKRIMRSFVFYLHGSGGVTSRQRASKGNVISFDLDPSSTLRALTNRLPRRAESLSDVLSVRLVVAPATSDDQVRKQPEVKRVLQVRRSRIAAALNWLHGNNILYSTLDIDSDALHSLPVDGVPESFWTTSIRRVTGYSNPDDAERAGYVVQVDDAAHESSGVNTSGMLDSNGTRAAAEQIRFNVYQCLIGLNVGMGSKPVSEYDRSAELIASAFPCLFPYGVGAPGFKTGECESGVTKEVSFEEHIRLLLEHRENRFGGHPTFVFVALNMLRRRDANAQVRAVMRHADAEQLSTELSAVDPDVLEELKTTIASNPKMSSKELFALLPPCISRLLSKLTVVAGNVRGTALEKRRAQHVVTNFMYTLGPPTLFITINPNDFTSSVLMHWATRSGSLDEEHPEFMAQINCLKTVAQHPHLAAALFREVCTAFEKLILGADMPDATGVFGRLAGYYGVVEAQGRGTLHAHYVVWIQGSGTPAGMRQRIGRDEGLSAAMNEYLDDIICSRLSATALATLTGTASDSTARPETWRPPSIAAPSCNGLDVEFEAMLSAGAEAVALRANMHSRGHTHTCFKGGKHTCRFGFPKELCPVTSFDNAIGGFVIERNDAYVNAYSRVLSYLLRCNNDIKLLQSTNEAVATVLYVVSYIAKNEATTHSLVSMLRDAFEAELSSANSTAVAFETMLRKPLLKTAMKLIGNTETSAPMACLLLTRAELQRRSHDVRYIPFGAAKALLRRQVHRFEAANDDDSGTESTGSEDGVGESLSSDTDADVPVTLTLVHDSDVGTQITGSSLLLDYVHRPDEAGDINLLEYCVQQHKAKCNSDKRRKRDAAATLLFLPEHKQHDTHTVLLKADLLHNLIPVLVGGHVPANDPTDPAYCLAVVALLYPWRLETFLHFTSWPAKLQELQSLGAMSPYSTNFLNNIQLLHVYDRSRNADLIQRDKREREQLAREGRRAPTVEPGEPASDDILTMLALPELDLDSMPLSEEKQADYVTAGMDALRSVVNLQSNAAQSQPPGAFQQSSESKEFPDTMEDECQAQLKHLRAAAAEPPRHVSTGAVSGHSTDVVSYAKGPPWHLNDEQFAIFLAVVRHTEMTAPPVREEDAPPPNFWILTGEGGSGKTHVLRCIIDYFAKRGWSELLRVAATTGAAAANLQRSASTIDSLLGLSFGSQGRKRTSNDAAKAATVNTAFSAVRYLILDEYSMLCCSKLTEICQRLKDWQPTEYAAGRVSILFAGDPHQFQPVKGTSLTQAWAVLQATAQGGQPSSGPSGGHATSSASGPSAAAAQDGPSSAPSRASGPTTAALKKSPGAAVWVSITDVVVLTQNYRQHACPVLHDILMSMRSNTLTHRHIDLLRGRVLRRGLREPPVSTTMIVQRNKLRIAASQAIDVRRCQTASIQSCVVESLDSLTNHGDIPPHVQRWIDAFAKPSECEQLPKTSVFYKGQQISFTQNLAPEVGVANGSTGIVESIIVDAMEASTPNSPHRVLTRLPRCILVRVSGLQDVTLHSSLPPGVIAVAPTAARCSVTVKLHSNKQTLPFIRHSFPLISTSCITDFKSQGCGFDSVIVDLRVPPEGRKEYILAVYVMLSRAKTLNNLYILAEFDPAKILESKFPVHITSEWARMCALSLPFVQRQLSRNA